MKKIILATMLALSLGACTTDGTTIPINVTKLQVIEIPDGLYECPIVNLPDPKTLTEKQIGNLLFAYEKANHVCRTNLNTIRKYANQLKTQLDIIQKRR